MVSCEEACEINVTVWKLSVLGVFLVRIFPNWDSRSEYGKIRTRKTPNMVTFHAVYLSSVEQTYCIKSGWTLSVLHFPVFEMNTEKIENEKNSAELLFLCIFLILSHNDYHFQSLHWTSLKGFIIVVIVGTKSIYLSAKYPIKLEPMAAITKNNMVVVWINSSLLQYNPNYKRLDY